MDKKKLIILIILVVLIIVAGIALVLTRTRTTDPTSTGGQVTLVYKGLWEPDQHLQEVIDEYEAANPNVTIEYTQERYTQYEENMYERLADPNTTPDIIRISNSWTYKFQSRLASLPAELMSQSEYAQNFYPAALEDFTGSDGKIYAIPLEVDGLALYYNKDLFTRAGISDPPTDWDTLIENAIALTKKDASGNITQAGVAMGCSNNVSHSADILSALMLINGVDMVSADGTDVTFDTSTGAATLKYYTDFVTEHEVWSCTLRPDLDMFIEGKLAMMFGPSWRTFDIINNNPQINFGTSPLPQLAGADEPTYYGMYWGEAVSAESQNQYEAWRFVKYLSEAEQQQKMYSAELLSRAFGEPYSRPDLASEIEDSAYVGTFITMAPDLKAWQVGDQTTTTEALEKAISDVIDGRETETSALTTAAETIQTAIDELY